MKLLIRSAVLATSAATLVAVGASPSPADPKVEFIPLDCDGTAYTISVNGNGAFTPAHDTGSSGVFVPTRFGEFHGTVTDSEGTVLDDFTEPPLDKGRSAKAPRTWATCTYTVHDEFEDPDLGVLTFDGQGEVTGFWTPARK